MVTRFRHCFYSVNASKIHQFKAKNSEIKPYFLLLRNISKGFTANNMRKKCLQFSVDYNIIDTGNIIDICKYLMKTHHIKRLVN